MQAYQQLVEQLLASPHYGERMAIGWLDVVRFADTIGYHSDNPRNVWPYRDYVIRALNQNKPFNEFTVEQLAGDLLLNSTQDQKVASCFNRLLLTTEEGGAQPKDYEARMLADRVRAVGTVWLGQTFGCCQCHDHKFDPMTMRDFYSMGAFFADIQEPILGRREEGMMLASAQQSAELARLDAEIVAIQGQLAATTPELLAAQKTWEAAAISAQPSPGKPVPPKEIVAVLKTQTDNRTEPQKLRLSQYYREIAPQLADVRARLGQAQGEGVAGSRGPALLGFGRDQSAHGSPPASWRLDERERSGDATGSPGVLASPKDRRTAPDAAGPGPMDYLARQPVDRARVRQPFVETVFRDRYLSQDGRLGLPG